MEERLELTYKRYNEIKEELTNPEVFNDVNKTRELSIEMSELEEIANIYVKYKKLKEDISEHKELLNDPELGDVHREELPVLEENLQ